LIRKSALNQSSSELNSDTVDVLKLEHQLCFRLYMASRNMTRLYAPILEKYHLTYPQYIIILVLLEHGEMDFKKLSETVDLKTGTMTPIMQRMEELGYIQREKNPMDARKITIRLTNAGSSLREQLVSVPLELAHLIQLEKGSYLELIGRLDQLTEKLTKAQNTQNTLNTNNT